MIDQLRIEKDILEEKLMQKMKQAKYYKKKYQEANIEIERLNKDRNKLYENGLNDFLELQKKIEENERLNNIIKEAKEFIYNNAYDTERENCIDDLWGEIPKLLEILDKENK